MLNPPAAPNSAAAPNGAPNSAAAPNGAPNGAAAPTLTDSTLSDVSIGGNQCTITVPENTVKRKRGRPKGSTKKVVSSTMNSLILPTSASAPPLGPPVSMRGWLGGTSAIGQDASTSKKSHGNTRKPTMEPKELQLVPMSLIVQPKQ
eukprot:3652458-Pyramimonas_sp.AAC.1